MPGQATLGHLMPWCKFLPSFGTCVLCSDIPDLWIHMERTPMQWLFQVELMMAGRPPFLTALPLSYQPIFPSRRVDSAAE